MNYLSLTNFVMLYTYLKKIKDADEKKRTIEHLIQLRRQLDDARLCELFVDQNRQLRFFDASGDAFVGRDPRRGDV